LGHLKVTGNGCRLKVLGRDYSAGPEGLSKLWHAFVGGPIAADKPASHGFKLIVDGLKACMDKTKPTINRLRQAKLGPKRLKDGRIEDKNQHNGVRLRKRRVKGGMVGQAQVSSEPDQLGGGAWQDPFGDM
jgi:hypothetical protein